MSDPLNGPPLRMFVAVAGVALVGLLVVIVFATTFRPSAPVEEAVDCDSVPASVILNIRPYCEATREEAGIIPTEQEMQICIREVIEASKSYCRKYGEW